MNPERALLSSRAKGPGGTRWGRRGRGDFSRSGRVSNFEPHQSELAPSGHEDVGVDDQHDQQGNQHTAEEIEIDHPSIGVRPMPTERSQHRVMTLFALCPVTRLLYLKAMAIRLKMELWVRMRTKQAMNRQPKKLAQKPGIASSPTAISATASDTTKKLVMLCRLELRQTAQQTRTFPATDRKAITSSRPM
ncbi:hypothetical protein EYF80_019042 [Liparis tanakae]|uniref:Uncharacterized protein n=1 Tax=Liparis tanakae TaxID=230148 RepID=A0A4Z2HY40_9TELE|nr:hypothetical protein EYF80_019042 [Liparis tanakae]